MVTVLPGVTGAAFAAPTTVTCPTVNQTTGAVTPAPSPGVDWSGCDLDNAIMSGADLAGANLSGASITGESRQEELVGANLSGANLSSAVMALTGTPASLPADWSVLAGYLIGPGANLQVADLANQNLSGMNLTGTRFLSTNLTSTNLDGANLDGALLDNANLLDAHVTGATFTDAFWGNTICPDGTNSNAYEDGCFSPLDTAGPTASPEVTSGTAGANGWYTSAVTVSWNWTDPGTIEQGYCQQESTTSGNGANTLQATCDDQAGNVGHATYTVDVDPTRPAVSVTGVGNGAEYVLGRVPAAGCRTSDAVSGVATSARLELAKTAVNGVGRFTATCSGAVSVAGAGQGAPVAAGYTVAYGFGGFSGLRPGEVIAKSARTITARFRITRAGGKDVLAAPTAAFAARHALEVRLTGPGIKAVTASCRWVSSARMIECAIKIPVGVRLGRGNRYKVTAEENVGAGFVVAPAIRGAVNPLVITFTSG